MQTGGTAVRSSEHEKQREAARERQASETSAASDADSVVTSEPDNKKESDWDTPEVTPVQDDPLRQSLASLKYGDFTIYKYFFKPAGVFNIVFWLAIIGCASVIDRIPRTLP